VVVGEDTGTLRIIQLQIQEQYKEHQVLLDLVEDKQIMVGQLQHNMEKELLDKVFLVDLWVVLVDLLGQGEEAVVVVPVALVKILKLVELVEMEHHLLSLVHQ
jgi:hypothetical protein